MAQALRSRKYQENAPLEGQITASGTYESDKVVIEWERPIAIDELALLLNKLPARTYKKSELRSYISGHMQATDQNLPRTKLTHYRISGSTLDQFLNLLVKRGLIEKVSENSSVSTWKKI